MESGLFQTATSHNPSHATDSPTAFPPPLVTGLVAKTSTPVSIASLSATADTSSPETPTVPFAAMESTLQSQPALPVDVDHPHNSGTDPGLALAAMLLPVELAN